jgi:hypothetical protein
MFLIKIEFIGYLSENIKAKFSTITDFSGESTHSKQVNQSSVIIEKAVG